MAAWPPFDQPIDGVWPSDHFGVLVDVELGQDPEAAAALDRLLAPGPHQSTPHARLRTLEPEGDPGKGQDTKVAAARRDLISGATITPCLVPPRSSMR